MSNWYLVSTALKKLYWPNVDTNSEAGQPELQINLCNFYRWAMLIEQCNAVWNLWIDILTWCGLKCINSSVASPGYIALGAHTDLLGRILVRPLINPAEWAHMTGLGWNCTLRPGREKKDLCCWWNIFKDLFFNPAPQSALYQMLKCKINCMLLARRLRYLSGPRRRCTVAQQIFAVWGWWNICEILVGDIFASFLQSLCIICTGDPQLGRMPAKGCSSSF